MGFAPPYPMESSTPFVKPNVFGHPPRKELKHLGLYFCENLHAKCYFNENLMVITSMNLHEFSQTNNREMGVLIKREEEKDHELFMDAKNEADFIIHASETKINRLHSESKDGRKELDFILNEDEQKLFNLLKSFRYKASERERILPYMVFHDTDLKYIAKLRPKTKEELLNIKGIAIRKYEKYGEGVLKIVNEFYNKGN